MSYNKVPTLIVFPSSEEDFLEWSIYLKNQMNTSEVEGSDHCMWDLIDGTYVLSTTRAAEVK